MSQLYESTADNSSFHLDALSEAALVMEEFKARVSVARQQITDLEQSLRKIGIQEQYVCYDAQVYLEDFGVYARKKNEWKNLKYPDGSPVDDYVVYTLGWHGFGKDSDNYRITLVEELCEEDQTLETNITPLLGTNHKTQILMAEQLEVFRDGLIAFLKEKYSLNAVETKGDESEDDLDEEPLH